MKLSELPDGHIVKVDTETSNLYVDAGGRIAAVSFAYRVPDENGDWDETSEIVHQALSFDQGINNLPLGDKELPAKHLKRLSRWPDWALDEDANNLHPDEFARMCHHLGRMRLVWHNAKFDKLMFRAGLRGRPDLGVDFEDNTIWDTMLAQSVIDPQHPTGLKPTSLRLGLGRSVGVKEGMETAEQEALSPWLGPKTGKNADPRYDLVPWSVMGPYAGMDALLTLLLFEHQWDEIYHADVYLPHIRKQIDFMKVLYRMEGRGVGFDLDTAFKMETLVEQERQRVAATLPFEPTPNKARKFFFGSREEGGLEHPLFTDKLTEKRGDPQVDDEVVTRLATEEWEGQEVAKIYQDHEGLKSANAKWYGSWPYLAGLDGRLRTNYRQAHVVSGRLSAERFQSQAIPHDYQLPKVDGLVTVRNLFIEDTECPCGCGTMETWEFDVSQAEIRIATAMAECVGMRDGFAQGLDSHTIATKLMFGERLEAEGFGGNLFDQHPEWDKWRQVGKRCNLGILYGAGVKVIQEQLLKFANMRVPTRQVSQWIGDWNAAFPEMGARLELLEQRAVRMGWVKLIDGRQAWFSPYDQLHKAFNREIQGSLASVMVDVMIDVENKHPHSLLLQIHDSVTLRIARHEREEVKASVTEILRTRFEQAFTRKWKSGELVTIPFLSDAKPFGRKPVAA